ncbi:MAG TPA: rhodanese-like domain-containing protein, partial [Prolixibacteraceae bacterium]|nr:rhodanese-like domain-containing protein [Prolixibacteraceae bacterium]
MDINEKRNPKRENSQMVPQPVSEDPGMVLVDTTWGKIQPINIAEGVLPVDEIQVYKYQQKEFQLIDARKTNFYKESTIPGSKNI